MEGADAAGRCGLKAGWCREGGCGLKGADAAGGRGLRGGAAG